MKTTARKLLITIPTLIFALGAIVLRTIACLGELDYNTGLFADSTLWRVSGYTVAAVTVLLLLLLAVKIEVAERRASFRGPLTYLPSGVLATALVLSAVNLIEYSAGELGNIFTRALLSRFDCLTALLVAVLALCGAGYCIASVLIPAVRSNLRANLGMLAALGFAIYTVHLFFRTDTPLNNPAKVADEMAFLSAALFMLSETRLSLGRARWKDYFIFAAVSAVLSGYASLPALVTYILRGEIISASIQQSLLLFAFTLFSVLKLINAIMLDRNRASSFVTAIDKDALASDEEKTPEDDAERTEPPQLSIDDIEESERQGEE